MAERVPGQFRNPPSWMRRALNPNTPTTAKRETVRTASDSHNGKEILFPTIRVGRDGKLRKMTRKVAKEEALRRRDYLTFDTSTEATKFSKKLSRLIGRSRNN